MDAVELERRRVRDESRGVRKGQFSEGFIGHGEDFDFRSGRVVSGGCT